MAWLVASQGARRMSTGPDTEVGGHHMTARAASRGAGVLHAVMPGHDGTACGVELRHVRVWPMPWPPDVGGMNCAVCSAAVAASAD